MTKKHTPATVDEIGVPESAQKDIRAIEQNILETRRELNVFVAGVMVGLGVPKGYTLDTASMTFKPPREQLPRREGSDSA